MSTSELQVVKIAVLVAGGELTNMGFAHMLDVAFEDVDEVLQFAVEGQRGWRPGTEPTVESILAGAVDGAADQLLDPDEDDRGE